MVCKTSPLFNRILYIIYIYSIYNIYTIYNIYIYIYILYIVYILYILYIYIIYNIRLNSGDVLQTIDFIKQRLFVLKHMFRFGKESAWG